MKDLLAKFFETIDRAIFKINGLLPTLTPAQAHQLIKEINGLQNALDDARQKLQNVKPGLMRIVNGDTATDLRNQAEMSRAWAKLSAIENKTDDYSQMVRNIQTDMQEDKARMAAEAAEKKRVIEERMAFIFRQTHR